jgi:hypothetical protein
MGSLDEDIRLGGKRTEHKFIINKPRASKLDTSTGNLDLNFV